MESKKHVLFICSQNRLRSPTAEKVFADWPGIEVASAGLNEDATVPLRTSVVLWADLLFVMERSQKNRLQRKFRDQLVGKKVICLEIPDEYEFMDPDLVTLLKARISPFLAV